MADSDLSSEDILHPGTAQARIEELDGIYAREGDSADWEDVYADEYAALLKLRQLVTAEWSEASWTDNPGLLRDSYWEEYADHQAHDIYGEATETPYWDGKRYAEDMKQGFQSIEWDGATWYGN